MSTFAISMGVVATLAQLMTVPAPDAIPVEKSPGKIQVFMPERVTPRPSVALTARSPRDEPLVDEPSGHQPPVAEPQGAVVRLEPRVVCGMTIIPVPPTADTRMAKPVPSDVSYHIRKVAPTICTN